MSSDGASADTFRRVPMPKPSIGAPRRKERGHVMLVQPAAHEDLHVGQPPASSIRRTAPASAARSPLSSRTPASRTPGREPARHLDGQMRRGDRVVSIEQEHRTVREGPGVGLERPISPGNALTKECAIVPESGMSYAFPASTSLVEAKPVKIRGPRGLESRVHAMRAAEPELGQCPAAGREHRARGLARLHGLEMAEVDDRRLHELRLDERTRRLEQRLVGEQDGSLADRTHVAGEAEIGEEVEEGRLEPAQRAEVRQRIGRKAEIAEKLQRVLEPRGYQEPPLRRQPAHEQAERGGAPDPSRRKAAAIVSSYRSVNSAASARASGPEMNPPGTSTAIGFLRKKAPQFYRVHGLRAPRRRS